MCGGTFVSCDVKCVVRGERVEREERNSLPGEISHKGVEESDQDEEEDNRDRAKMSGLMGPPPPTGPSRAKRRATSDSSASISDYVSAEDDDDDNLNAGGGGGGGRGGMKRSRAAPSLASAGSPQFDAYVHEGHYFNFLGYQTFL